MAKMMMGQIDHARKRVAELKAEKSGVAPTGPKALTGSTYKKAFKDGAIKTTPAKLKQAWDCYTSGILRPHVEKQELYCYGPTPNQITYEIGEAATSSMEDALASFEYEKVNAAEVTRFNKEREIYQLRQEALELEASTVEDAIVLGDQHAALAALQNFAAFVVGF